MPQKYTFGAFWRRCAFFTVCMSAIAPAFDRVALAQDRARSLAGPAADAGDAASQEGAHGGGFHCMGCMPAPIMGAVMIPKGAVMTNFIAMWMHNDGPGMGTGGVTPEQVVTTVPNRFAGMPMPGYPAMKQPALLRTAPLDMDMNAQMLGVMYGVSNTVNLMIMPTYVEKDMTMLVFKGATGTTRLGTSKVSAEGPGDTTASALVRLYEVPNHEVHIMLGAGLPTGSITQSGYMLSPSGITMKMRLNYGMQPGDGTIDAAPAAFYTGKDGKYNWGAMYRGRLPLQQANGEGWRIGNMNQLTGWAGYALAPWLTGTVRLAGTAQDAVHGLDTQITGPAPGANPDFYGGESINAFAGLSAKGEIPGIGKGRVAVEFGVPLYQRVNGVQAQQDWALSLSAMAHF